jgi:hypothetical protein
VHKLSPRFFAHSAGENIYVKNHNIGPRVSLPAKNATNMLMEWQGPAETSFENVCPQFHSVFNFIYVGRILLFLFGFFSFLVFS